MRHSNFQRTYNYSSEGYKNQPEPEVNGQFKDSFIKAENNMDYSDNDILDENAPFDDFAYDNIYNMPRMQKTNIKRDLF